VPYINNYIEMPFSPLIRLMLYADVLHSFFRLGVRCANNCEGLPVTNNLKPPATAGLIDDTSHHSIEEGLPRISPIYNKVVKESYENLSSVARGILSRFFLNQILFTGIDVYESPAANTLIIGMIFRVNFDPRSLLPLASASAFA